MRLIDADALELDVQNLWMQNEISNGDWVGFREMLNSQETIVEFAGDINKVMVKGIEYFPQKTGEWVWVQYDSISELGDWYCSECRFMPSAFNLAKKHLNYCPNCGASMRGEEE